MPPVSLLAARSVTRPRCRTCLLVKHSTRPDPAPRSSTCRFFRTTGRLLLVDLEATARKNHYERLGVKHDASAADIKRSFYRLSKTHHPDANRSDPNAASCFSLLSESYTLLSDPSRRAAYDRDTLRLHTSSSNSGSAQPRGSYSSASQAGGRSPSGLSRRRTTFRGPPPSFYRNGGWGTQGEKRQKAHDESTGYNGANSSETSSSSSSAQGDHQPGMGPGSDPFSHTYAHPDDIPHFNQASHKRTHEREDVRRQTRQRYKARRAWGDDNIEFEPQTSIAGHFAIVTGILAVTFLAPFFYLKVVGDRKRVVKPGERY